jgi:outer membrane protein
MLQKTKNTIWILLFANLLGLAIVGYVSFFKAKDRTAFILNQKVFNAFLGKQELEKRLKQLQLRNNKSIDSLSILIQQEPESSRVTMYQENIRLIKLNEQQLSETYTAEIWKQINSYLDAYGKEMGYDFIFGAVGNGSLMYGGESNDVTNEVIDYINRKYIGE